MSINIMRETDQKDKQNRKTDDDASGSKQWPTRGLVRPHAAVAFHAVRAVTVVLVGFGPMPRLAKPFWKFLDSFWNPSMPRIFFSSLPLDVADSARFFFISLISSALSTICLWVYPASRSIFDLVWTGMDSFFLFRLRVSILVYSYSSSSSFGSRSVPNRL